MLNEYVKTADGVSFFHADAVVNGVLFSSWSRDSQVHAKQALMRVIASQKAVT